MLAISSLDDEIKSKIVSCGTETIAAIKFIICINTYRIAQFIDGGNIDGFDA